MDDARKVWEDAAGKKFDILSDTKLDAVRAYGLVHSKGKGDSDIAIRATILVDGEGKIRWRYVSSSVEDLTNVAQTLDEAKKLH